MSYRSRNGNYWAALSLVVLLVLASCADDEVSTISDKKALFTLIVDDGYRPDLECWIIIHNQEGEVLDYEPYSGGDSITLTTDKEVPNDLISVTRLEHRLNWGTTDVYYLGTVTDIHRGQRLFLQTFIFDNSANVPSGSFYVKLNSSDFADWRVSTRVPYICNYSSDFDNGGLGITSHLYANQTRYMLTIQDAQKNNKYKFFDNIQDGDTINVNENELLSFDRTVTFNFPLPNTGYNLMVWAQESSSYSPGFIIRDHQRGANQDPAVNTTVGYLNSLPYLQTSLYVLNNQISYGYSCYDAPPLHDITITPFNPPIIQDTTLQSFRVAPVDPFKVRFGRWSFNKTIGTVSTGTVWDVTSPGDSQKLTEFPSEITHLFPNLQISNLQYEGSNYVTQSTTFDVGQAAYLRTGVFSNGKEYYSAFVFD